jgi:D-alanyl-D-alanine carboxypeptidase/D-alanyl-D-alanine-endopeptidase (penicillin-binding protein 4)
MKNFIFLSLLLSMGISASTQTLTQKIQKAFQQFQSDPQLKNAISSLYVIDANTGKAVFEKNSYVGLAPASTQKIITAATAFEVLGKDYRFKTEVRGQYNDTSTYLIYVTGYGDPSLGSWRFDKDGNSFFTGMHTALKADKRFKGRINILVGADPYFERLSPDGWIFQDLGNYYGASANGFNWGENQIDVTFIPGKQGEPAAIDTVATNKWIWQSAINDVKTGASGSGDNTNIYIPLTYNFIRYHIKGTVPAGVNRFTISGAEYSPVYPMSNAFQLYCKKNDIVNDNPRYYSILIDDSSEIEYNPIIYTHYSPTLDSLSYWFLQKSINLYGEAFIKTMAFEKYHYGSTDEGVQIVKDFWKGKGLDVNELNMFDGSGLSPQNRLTTHVQVEVLKYARQQPWFADYFKGFPNYNDMKMKSGTIRNVKGFAGYHKAKNGKEYIFSFLVNNYNGSTSALVNKMYKVLDLLK